MAEVASNCVHLPVSRFIRACSHITRFFPFLIVFIACIIPAAAQMVTGLVTGTDGRPLASASVYIKGGTRGTSTNNDGRYGLSLRPGEYTLVCAFVGYQKAEKKITISNENLSIDFKLYEQQTELREVVVRANAEDPAYAIIRNAIKARRQHLDEVKQWQAMVYMKGLIRTYVVPRSVLGVKFNPNRDFIDSSGKGIIYFSESLTRYYRSLPNDFKEEVISAKVSGNSQGFGFNSPKDLEINFYQNNILIEGLTSRGFVSPIHDNAFNFYWYKYEGSFYEDGREISRIRVIPKRKYEPVFAGGYISIIEDSWRIHSADMKLSKESQIQLVDSLRIQQQYFPAGNDIWMPQQTSIVADFGIFGFSAGARFTASYSDYVLGQNMDEVFKSRVIRKIDTSANKKTVAYWDSIRPTPLTAEERNDYLRKDSIERKYKDPAYLDSLDRITNRVSAMKLLVRGSSFVDRKTRSRLIIPPAISMISYNTVEGWALNMEPVWRRVKDTGSMTVAPVVRYGFRNGHFNASLRITGTVGKDYHKRWTLTGEGGKQVLQINNDNPIGPLNNTFGTLLYTVNYLKIYERWVARVAASRVMPNGMRLFVGVNYEDRLPLENTDTSYKWREYKNRSFTSNYPEELPAGYFEKHQAFISTVRLTWQPGQKFIEYPNRRILVSSNKPVFSVELRKAWKWVFGADADWGRWTVSVTDDVNMRLGGNLQYNLSSGGFIRNQNVQLPDWQHFLGNQTIVAGPFVRAFQLAPYYANSTKDNFYARGHFEWHLNGLFTNKIPLVRRWNLGFVTGSNAFYVDSDRNYFELFFGIENILKSFRVDWVWGYDGVIKSATNGIVIGFSGLFTGQGVE